MMCSEASDNRAEILLVICSTLLLIPDELHVPTFFLKTCVRSFTNFYILRLVILLNN